MSKRKKKKAAFKPRDEIRKLHTVDSKGHAHYIFGESGSDYESLGITHGSKTKGIINIPLTKNPNPQDSKPAYIRPKITKEKKTSYGKKLNRELCAEDKKLVAALIEMLRSKK